MFACVYYVCVCVLCLRVCIMFACVCMFACVLASVYDREELDSQCPVDGAAVDSPSADAHILPNFSDLGRDVYPCIFCARDKLYNNYVAEQ